MNIKENLFDLTSEQISMSKTIYNGITIKCLVAPYHTYEDLEKIVKYTPTTYLFPEKELSLANLPKFISMIVNQKPTEEVRIITANQNIILDMVDSSVRILTEGGDVVACPEKTFMANIHTIRYKILENPDHQISKEEKNRTHKEINKILEDIQKGTMTQLQYDQAKEKINLIGEQIIRNIMLNNLNQVKII